MVQEMESKAKELRRRILNRKLQKKTSVEKDGEHVFNGRKLMKTPQMQAIVQENRDIEFSIQDMNRMNRLVQKRAGNQFSVQKGLRYV